MVGVAGFGLREETRAPRTYGGAGTYADQTPLATSFRVYTPAEIRTSRLRSTTVAPPPEAPLTPQKLAQLMGIGLGALVLAFVAFLVIGNLTDDTAHPRAVRAVAARPSSPPDAAPIPAPVAAFAAAPVVVVPVNDFEIGDDLPPARSAAKAKAKQHKRRIVRTN